VKAPVFHDQPAATRARALRLRPERPWQEHARLYEDLFCDPAVSAALWPGQPAGEAARRRAAGVLASDIEHWQQRSFGPWVFFEIATGMFVGRGGLRNSTVVGTECVEVVCAVRPDAWGQGYATDMAALAVDHARHLRLTEVVGLTATGNLASRRVLEKAGMRLVERVEHAGLPHVLGRLRMVL
jgi:[ribosomal protein S5]-alanine N-acetyltransferase